MIQINKDPFDLNTKGLKMTNTKRGTRSIIAGLALATIGGLFAGNAGAADKLHIGASVLGLQFPAVVAFKEGMEEEAAQLGVDLSVVDAAGSAPKQANDIADLIALGVDGIVINALDSTAIQISSDQILDAQIALASAFTTLGTAECAYPGSIAHAGFDEAGFAKTQGEEAVKLLQSGGEVATIDGLAGLQASRIRHDGFVAELAAVPAIKLVSSQPGNFDRTTARAVADNILQANPDLDLIYAADDNMAMGAVQAVEAAGLQGQVKVLGLGGSIEGLESVKAGKLHSTVYSSLREGGREIVKAMVESLSADVAPAEACLLLPQTLVTSANVDQFAGKGEF